MGNRRRPRQDATRHRLDNLAGRTLPGGCDDCDAYQTIEGSEGLYFLTVHHDDTCPWLRAQEQR